LDLHLGSGGLSYAAAGLGFGVDGTLDIGIPLKLSLNAAGDFGIGPGGIDFMGDYSPLSMVLGGFGGVFGHFYIPFTDISLGAGYGYRAEMPLGGGYDSFYSPFIRAEALYKGMGIYFEYYINPIRLFDDDNPSNPYVNVFKKWGVGFFGRM